MRNDPPTVETPLLVNNEDMMRKRAADNTSNGNARGGGSEGSRKEEDETHFPPHTFTFARKTSDGRRFPQAIAHRGYKDKFPENTLGAFRGAVEVGAQAIETDIHLTKDGVVVLSHDPTLKRCFGKEEKVIDCDWEYLKELRTLREPHEPMPRFSDLLEYLTQPGLEDIWVMIDVKMDNEPNEVLRLIAETLKNTPALPNRPWSDRIVLGIWAARYLSLCYYHLPGYRIAYIGFSVLYASKFLAVPHISFNMMCNMLMTPWGRFWLRRAKSCKRPVYAWTVNDAKRMRWSIGKELDGVVTDDPKLYLEICKNWDVGGEKETAKEQSFGPRIWWQVVWVQILIWTLGWWYMWKFKLGNPEKRFVKSS